MIGARSQTAHSAGFTLLEVMIALAILAMSLTVIAMAQSNAVRAEGRAKQMTIATLLAREKMVDVEDELFEEGFSDFDEEEKGDFDEQGFKSFSYVLKVDKIELPTSINADSLTSALSGGVGAEGDNATAGSGDKGGMFAAGAKLMSAQFEMFRNILEQSIRRVSVRVSWKEGTRERYVAVVGYFTDPRKIGFGGAVSPGAPADGDAEAAERGAGASSSGQPGTTRTGLPTAKTLQPERLRVPGMTR